jgi:hypothetical protein
MYRVDIRENIMDLKWNGVSMKYEAESQLLKAHNGDVYKKEIKPFIVEGKKVGDRLLEPDAVQLEALGEMQQLLFVDLKIQIAFPFIESSTDRVGDPMQIILIEGPDHQ